MNIQEECSIYNSYFHFTDVTFKHRNLFFHSPGDWKSKTKATIKLVSGGTSLPGL